MLVVGFLLFHTQQMFQSNNFWKRQAELPFGYVLISYTKVEGIYRAELLPYNQICLVFYRPVH